MARTTQRRGARRARWLQRAWAETVAGRRVAVGFHALLTAARVEGGVRLYAPDVPLPDDATEICDLVREGSPIGRRLVEAIFDDDALPLRPATYLNERATLGRLIDDPRLVDDLDAALNALRQGDQSANQVLRALITAYQSLPERPVADLWAAKATLEALSVHLDIRRHVARQVNRWTEGGDGVDAGLQLAFRAQTLDLLYLLAEACERGETALLERMDLSDEERGAVSVGLFAAYVQRAAQLGVPLAVDRVAWHVPPPHNLDGAHRRRGPAPRHAAPTVLAVMGAAQAVIPAQQIADPLHASAAIWNNVTVDLSKVAAPWAAPAPEFPSWSFKGEAAQPTPRPLPQLQLALTTTGDYSLVQLADYFGFRSATAVQFLTAENLDLLAQVKPGARVLPPGLTVVVPATLLPLAEVTSLEETARTFDTEVAALARLNPARVAVNADGKATLRAGTDGYLLVPVGRAELLGPEVMTTRPISLDIGSSQAPLQAARPGTGSAAPRVTSETPTPRLRHVRLHHTLTQATTIASLASQLGLPAGALAEYNGLTDVGRVLPAGANVLLPGTVHRVAEGEDLSIVVARYEVPGDAIEQLNGKLFVGQALFVPQPPSRLLAEGVFEARPTGNARPAASPPQSLPETGAPAAPAAKASASITGATTASVFPDHVEMPGYLADWDQYKAKEAALKAKYGQKLYPSLQAMPDDVREFYLTSVYWGAQLIGVPWQAVVAIHNTELVGKGYRPFEQAVSFAAARGPGQITPGYWNGWAGSGRSAAPSKNFADIIKNNGNGFHWGLRAEWLRYLRHEVGLDALKSTDADIMYFINNVVATARGLSRNRVTVSAFPADPKQWSAANIKTLRDAVMIYNSGGTNPAVRQCSGCAWTVGDYANNAERVARALPASPFDLLPAEARTRALRQQLYMTYDATFAASLSAQQMQQALTSYSDKVGDLTAGGRTPQETARAIVDAMLNDWLKVAERQPDAWPFFINQEARDVQLAAARHLATFLDKPALDELLARHRGDVKAAEAELAARVEAQVVQMARESVERTTPNRVILNTTVRPLAETVIRTVFQGNVDPERPDLQAKLDEARRQLQSGAVTPKGTGGGQTGGTPAKPAPPARPTPPARPITPNKSAAAVPPPAATAEARDTGLSVQDVGQAQLKLTRGGADEAGAASVPASSRVTPPVATVSHERFIRLSAQVKTPNNSIQNNIRLFTARAAGRLDEFKVSGAGTKIDWAKLQKADVEATIVLAPGEKLDYNARYGPFSSSQGYASGPLVSGGTAPGVGACQVATLFKAAAQGAPDVKIWNGTKHPAIPGLNDVSAVSILSGSARQNLHLTNTGATPVVFRLRVVGDTATMRAERLAAEAGQASQAVSPAPVQVSVPALQTVEVAPAPGQPVGEETDEGGLLGVLRGLFRGAEPETVPALLAYPVVEASAPAPAVMAGAGAPSAPVAEAKPKTAARSSSPAPTALAEKIVAGAADLVGKYAYGNLRDGPAQGYYVCTDVVNYAMHAAGVPIVQNYKDAATVRWVGTHMSWFKGANVAKMVNSRQREFKAAETLPEPGWVIFIRREPYREASHEGVVHKVDVAGDRAAVITLEALGGFKRDNYNKANNVQTTTYSYQRGEDGVWKQTGISKTNRIVGYGAVRG